MNAGANRLSRQNSSLTKEIESQRIAKEVASDVRRILSDEPPTVRVVPKPLG